MEPVVLGKREMMNEAAQCERGWVECLMELVAIESRSLVNDQCSVIVEKGLKRLRLSGIEWRLWVRHGRKIPAGRLAAHCRMPGDILTRMIEAIGYLGSALVVTSLMMTRILRLRVISLMGSTAFLAYGVLIGSVPIMITNIVIMIINITYLWRATQIKEWFSLLEVRPESRYLEEFLQFHHEDILVHQPDWNGEIAPSDLTVLVLRDMQPAMAIVGAAGDDSMELRLDYAIPRFRDYRMGSFLYGSNANFFVDRNITTITASGQTKQHVRYLRKMGFVETEPGRYERSLVQQG